VSVFHISVGFCRKHHLHGIYPFQVPAHCPDCEITKWGLAPHPQSPWWWMMPDREPRETEPWAPIGEECSVSTSVQLWRIAQQGAGGTRCTKTRDCNKLFYLQYLLTQLAFNPPPPPPEKKGTLQDIAKSAYDIARQHSISMWFRCIAWLAGSKKLVQSTAKPKPRPIKTGKSTIL